MSKILLLLLIFSTSFCQSLDKTAYLLEELDEGSATRGKTLIKRNFYQGKKRYTCLACHAIEEPPYSKKRYAGPPLANSYYRESFKNKRYTKVADAISHCMTKYLNIDNSKDLKDLSAYLRSISDPKIKEAWAYVGPPKKIPDGIFRHFSFEYSFAGKVLFESSCQECHGKGAQLKNIRKYISRENIFKKLRGMQFFGEDLGKNPIYDASRLSDDDLNAIIAYIIYLQGK